LDETFLSRITDLAADNGIRLFFVKVQSRPPKHGPAGISDDEIQYQEELRKYVMALGFEYYDFTGDSAITHDMFRDRAHISYEHRKQWTQISYDRLSHILK